MYINDTGTVQIRTGHKNPDFGFYVVKLRMSGFENLSLTTLNPMISLICHPELLACLPSYGG